MDSKAPTIIDDIGMCSYKQCQQYDGKRCRLTGFQPTPICEPWLLDLIAENKKLKQEKKK